MYCAPGPLPLEMSKPVMDIRCYRPEDNACLTDIWYRASLVSHAFLPSDLIETQKEIVAERYLPETENWVAWVDGKPAGFIGLMESFISGLFVAPEQQGSGIGAALLTHAGSIRNTLFLEVYAANRRACSFYRRNGFSGVKRRETDNNGLAFPLIMMQRCRPYSSTRGGVSDVTGVTGLS